ncbi:hypothetical protein D3C76_766050 [compost metagenome]
MNDEARHDGRDQATAVQHDPHFAIAQHHVEVVIAQGAGALGGQVRLDPVRLTEQLQRLIQDVGTEIEPEPGTRAARLAPALTHLGAVTIKVRFKLGDLAQRPFRQQAAYREEVSVPAPVVEDAEQPLLLLGQLDERLGFGQIQRERLVDHHVLARQQSLTGDGGMGIVRGRYHHQIDRAVGQHLVQGADLAARQLGLHLGGITAHHPAQGKPRGAGQEGGVEGLSCKAVTHQGGVDCLTHGILR